MHARSSPIRFGLTAAAFALLLSICISHANTVELEMEHSTDLTHWTPLVLESDAVTEDGKLRLPATGNAGFFRLRVNEVSPPPDLEGYVLIPAGTFIMGSPQDEPGRFDNEGPQHEVTLTRSFFMKRTPVTYRRWREVAEWAEANGHGSMADGYMGSNNDETNTENDPVTKVSFYDVEVWLNAKAQWTDWNRSIPG